MILYDIHRILYDFLRKHTLLNVFFGLMGGLVARMGDAERRSR